MHGISRTWNSRTREAALKTESWSELQTVGQKGSYGKQAHQINPRTINTKMEACNLAFYVHTLKEKNVSFETYSKKHKGKNFCDNLNCCFKKN